MANVLEVTEQTFQAEVLQSAVPVLVDFWAPWCGPCRAIAPTVGQLADDYAGRAKIVKINVDEAQQLAASYGVNSIPALMIFKNGDVLSAVVGAQPKSRLQQLIDEAL